MSTLKGDVLPFVVKKQSSTRNKYAYDNKADVEDIAQLEVGDHRAPDTDSNLFYVLKINQKSSEVRLPAI